jgi:hypothetical protein
MQSYVLANHEIAAALYWDNSVPGCDFSVTGSPASLAALAAMGHSAGLQGRLVAAG